MPSNASLIAQAEKIANDKGVDVKAEGLTNLELIALVSELKNAEASAGEVGQAVPTQETNKAVGGGAVIDEPVDADVSQSDEVAEPTPPTLTDTVVVNSIPSVYKVAPGKAITCRRGVVGEGETIGIDQVGGGIDTLENMCHRGYLVKT